MRREKRRDGNNLVGARIHNIAEWQSREVIRGSGVGGGGLRAEAGGRGRKKK